MKLLALAACIYILSLSNLSAYEPHFLSDPTISPDGNQVCFVYQQDLWCVPWSGGVAKRLTATESVEFNPSWSPDGTMIAFSSNRDGQTKVYIMPSEGGVAQKISSESMALCDWFPDGKSLLCSKSNLSWGTSLFKISLDGKRPILVAEIGDSFSSLMPSGEKIIFNRYGDPYRESYRGSTNGDLWEYDMNTGKYQRLTNTDFTERYPVASRISSTIYFCAADSSSFQLFKAGNGDFTHPEKLSDFDKWSVRDLSIARQNDRIVFELFDQIWCYDSSLATESKFSRINIGIDEDDWKNLQKEENITDSYDDFTISDDEMLIAFTHKYDLFVMPRKGGDVRQVTVNQSGASSPSFLADNRTLVFLQNLNGKPNLYSVKIDSVFTVAPVAWYGAESFYVDRFYRSSNRWVIEYSDSLGGGRVAVADSLFKNIQPILTDKVIATNFVCSPDGSMAAFATIRDDIYLRELYIYDFSTGARRKVLTEDSWLYSITWLPDQKSLLYCKNDETYKTCRLDLVPRDELELDKDNWKEIFLNLKTGQAPDSLKTNISSSNDKKSLPKTKPPLLYKQINWNRIDKRVFTIMSDSDYNFVIQAADDTSFYYIKETKGKDRKDILYKVNIYGKNPVELSSFPIGLDYQFVKDKTLYYKESGKLKSFGIKTKSKSEISNSYTYSYNLKTLNEKVFEQVWGIFGKNFYDPAMHNRDWTELYNRFKPYLSYADNPSHLEFIIEEMIGEVNSSHTGYYPRSDSDFEYKPLAWLGLETAQRIVLPEGIAISRVYQTSALSRYFGINEGDILRSINGTVVSPDTSIDSLLTDQVDKRIALEFIRNGKTIPAVIKGLSWSQNRELWFQDKIERRKALTDELSFNRIGYVQIPRMSGSEYNNFISDIFTYNADKEALIIDIRGNVGGRIHNDLLNFLSLKPNAYSTSRRFGAVKNPTPGRTWTKPIVLLIDENSFSDAEIFPQLFKEAKLGTVVGMPTSGSVIGTWEVPLMDGSSMRMPGSGWYRLDGTNMEGNGAQPDIRVEMDLNDLVAENDLQLKKAVQVLLEKLK